MRPRLLFVMLVLALPLGAGVWAIADFAGRSAEQRAETQLAGLLRAGLQEYADVLERGSARANTTAARRDVQLALARRDRARLARLVQAEEGVQLQARGRSPVGTIRPPAAIRSVEVLVGGRRVGRVVVGITLDAALLDRLAKAIQLPAGDRIVFRPTKAADGTTVRIAGSDYRVVGATLLRGRHGTKLLLATPESRIDTIAAKPRQRVLIAGLITLGTLALLVYAFAPALARGRLLRQQRDQAGRILSHLGEGVFLVDDSGVIRLWNPSAEAITGLPAVSAEGRPAADVIPSWAEAQGRIPVADDRPRATTLPIALDDRELWLSISGVSFSEGTVYAFRDLTEERRLEQMRSDFVSTVSHELRTPLASIHGAVLTLAKRGSELDSDLHDRLLAIMLEQSERLSGLVEQILLAAQLDSGGLQFERERFDATGLARNVIETSRPRVPLGVSLELAASPNPPRVVGDPGKTRHVLTNLIDNAIKYSPDGGQIKVIIAPEADRLRFSVCDEGLGIPRNEQERIFEKFYRLDASMTRGVGGSGLGLYICRELIERMNGRIWVTSEPGTGSKFSFELPLAEPVAS